MTAFPLTLFGAHWGTGLVTHVVMSNPNWWAGVRGCCAATGGRSRQQWSGIHGSLESKVFSWFSGECLFYKVHVMFNICLEGLVHLFCWCSAFVFQEKIRFYPKSKVPVWKACSSEKDKPCANCAELSNPVTSLDLQEMWSVCFPRNCKSPLYCQQLHWPFSNLLIFSVL